MERKATKTCLHFAEKLTLNEKVSNEMKIDHVSFHFLHFFIPIFQLAVF